MVDSGKLYKVKSESHSLMSDSLRPHGLYSPWDSPGQNTGVGDLSLLWGIFPTQGSIPGLPHCRRIFNQLSHQDSEILRALLICIKLCEKLAVQKYISYGFCYSVLDYCILHFIYFANVTQKIARSLTVVRKYISILLSWFFFNSC